MARHGSQPIGNKSGACGRMSDPRPKLRQGTVFAPALNFLTVVVIVGRAMTAQSGGSKCDGSNSRAGSDGGGCDLTAPRA